jgi:methylamine---glutamate N-methyltransferase subunit B
VVAMTGTATVTELDLAALSVREVNRTLRGLPSGSSVRIRSARGQHNLAVGLEQEIDVEIDGPAGYYAGGLGKAAAVTVRGSAGWGAGENLMSGSVVVHGDASQSAAASAHGGLVAIHGDASLRAGISLKGGTLAVAGSVGRYCGFLAQAGTILIGGDAAAGLGDSLYEAVVYVAGQVRDLGTDARVEDLTADDIARVRAICDAAGFDHIDADNVTRVASAKQLYHFDTQHAGAY